MLLLLNNFPILNGNTLELHYGLIDETHSMDAIVQNKCEYEFLGIIKEIAAIFNAEIIIETEPLAEGGLRRWFKIISKEESKKSTIKIALVVALTTGILITPITSSISKMTEIFIERIFEDKEIKKLEKEKLKLEIEKLKRDSKINAEILGKNNTIKKRRSNFYEALDKYCKVKMISLIIEDESKKIMIKEEKIDRVNFKEFILVSDDLEPQEIDGAVIEIISPVLKRGNYKWMGIYKGEAIHFNMASKEFKTLVQTGKVEFKNGTSINCFLQIKKKVDNDAREKITAYDVVRVNHYFENETPIETPEGKRHRQKKEGEKNQLKMFDEGEIIT